MKTDVQSSYAVLSWRYPDAIQRTHMTSETIADLKEVVWLRLGIFFLDSYSSLKFTSAVD